MKKGVLVVIVLIIVVTIGMMLVNNKKDNGEPEGKKETVFKFVYKGVDITPGKEFSKDSIDETAGFTELQSCAFEGLDKVYTYESVEITTSEMKGKETIYCVYFLDDTLQTTEGIKMLDEKSKMIEVYGENYEETLNRHAYKTGKVELIFIIENDIITSIEYMYVV